MNKAESSLAKPLFGYATWLAGLAAVVFAARTLDRELPLEMISPKEAVLRGQGTIGARYEISGIPTFEAKATRLGYQNFYSGAGFSSVEVQLPVYVYSLGHNFQGKEYKVFIASDTHIPDGVSSFRVKRISPNSLKDIKVDGPVFDSEYIRLANSWVGTDKFNIDSK